MSIKTYKCTEKTSLNTLKVKNSYEMRTFQSKRKVCLSKNANQLSDDTNLKKRYIIGKVSHSAFVRMNLDWLGMNLWCNNAHQSKQFQQIVGIYIKKASVCVCVCLSVCLIKPEFCNKFVSRRVKRARCLEFRGAKILVFWIFI